jgi:hypothetical protein
LLPDTVLGGVHAAEGDADFMAGGSRFSASGACWEHPDSKNDTVANKTRSVPVLKICFFIEGVSISVVRGGQASPKFAKPHSWITNRESVSNRSEGVHHTTENKIVKFFGNKVKTWSRNAVAP